MGCRGMSEGGVRMRGGLLAGIAVAALLVAGCEQQPHSGAVLDSSIAGSASAPSAGTSPGAAPSTPSSPGPTSAAGGCATTSLIIGNADNGKTLCTRPGAALLVLLANGSGPIQHSGPLTPRPDGRLMLMRGETGAAYTAGRAGRGPGRARAAVGTAAPAPAPPAGPCRTVLLP